MGRAVFTGSSWRCTGPAASHQHETLSPEGSCLHQPGAALHRWRTLEAQQNSIALPCTVPGRIQETPLFHWLSLCIQNRECTDRQNPRDWWGAGNKRVVELLPEITNSDTEMPRNKVFFPPPTCPRSAGIHFTNLCCWLGVSSSASAFKPILNNGNIATESSVCWLRPIVHREWLSGRDGWACKRKCASNVDCYEVMGLGAIDQSEKSILNGKIMQHAAKGKDLGTILKSCNPSLGMQLNKGKKMKIKVCWETGDRNAFRE